LINGVTATTNMGSFNNNAGVNINDVANGSGLSSLSLNATHAEAFPGNAWANDIRITTGNITFNLNGLYSLAGFSLWNFNNAGSTFSWGINGVNIQTSTDGTNFNTVSGAPAQFAIATSTTQNSERFSFAPATAAYVRFQVLSNYGGTNTGLSEVQFDGTPATSVPEPFTIVGTLVGLGSGAALKRRLKAIESKSTR
jgi:F5/8 type C domain